MLRRVTRATLALAFALALVPALLTGPRAGIAVAAGPGAQDLPAPPEVDQIVYQTALTGPDLFEARTCPTGAASGEYVGEGFRLRVRGRCVQEAPAANLPLPAPGLTVLDNEVAVAFRVVAGYERVGLNLYARVKDSGNLMATYLNFGANKAEILRRDGNFNSTLTGRVDLRDLINPADWNRIALRMRGREAWLLLNDAPVLYASNVTDQVGGIGIGLVREGPVADTSEVAVVFKDLTLSTLADPEQP